MPADPTSSVHIKQDRRESFPVTGLPHKHLEWIAVLLGVDDCGIRQIPVTLSIGIAVGDTPAQLEPDQLMAAADEALYQAKAGGRDRIAGARVAAS